MKIHPAFLLIALLPACKPAEDPEAARLELERTRAAYEQQAADMQQRSEDLQRQLADLERAMRDKENAELRARLEAIEKENSKLMADTEEARRKSQQLRDELASQPVPKATPYTPPATTQPWSDPAADYSMFYDSLRPHGRWLEVDGHGYAFRPALADRPSWRPYVDGRWVSTDQGWAWSTSEPFGWACYHYGRWARVSRHGWIWIPGREWAPAWVSWRHGSDVVGWAPLPPHARSVSSIGHDCDTRYGLAPTSYTFISASDFGRTSYVNCGLPATRVTTVFQQTVNVTSIVFVARQNTCIQRGGPAMDWVEKHCRTRVPRATVRLADTPAPRGPRADRDQPAFVAAPVPLALKDGPRRTPVIAERVQKPVLLDGWKDVPQDQQAALREAIARQSRQPAPRPAFPDTPLLTTPQQQGTGLAVETQRPALPTTGGPGRPGGPSMNTQPTQPGFPGGQRPGFNPSRPGPSDRPGVIMQKEDPKAAELARQLAQQKEQLARQQAEAEALRQKMAAEQERQAAEAREKQAAEMSAREAAALREKQEAEMAAQQQELARRQAEAEAMRQQIEAQEKEAAAMRAQQEAEAAKTAQMAAAQQEAERLQQMEQQRQQQEAAMRAAQEEAQRQAMLEAQQREAAMRAQQEAEAAKAAEMAAAQQREAERQAKEAAERQAMLEAQQREAAMRAAQEESQRQAMLEAQQREAAMRAQQEAEMRARQEEAERQRQMELQRQQQEAAMRAAQQEAQRQAMLEAQQREAAMRAQQEAEMRARQEEAERQRQQQETGK